MLTIAAVLAVFVFAVLSVAFIIAGTCYALRKLGLFRNIERETLNTKRIEDLEGAVMALRGEIDRLSLSSGSSVLPDREVMGDYPQGLMR